MTDEGQAAYSTSEISLSRSIRFWLLLVFEIPSLSCSLFILYYFVTDSNIRHSLNNHTVLLLNITGFIFKCIDVPMYLNFIRVNTVWPQTPAHCLVWWLVDFGFYFVACILATWASIERHILVFHNSWLATRNRRLLIHYLPLVAILIYGTSFYTWVIFFLPCENVYEYDLPVCGALPCHSNDPIIGSWEVGAHGCGCTFILIIFSIGLVIRVIHEKRTRQQPVVWRKHRKMTLQMLFISAAFVIFNLPIMVMFMAHYLGLPANVGVEVQLYFFFLTYWLQFVLPFASLKSLPHAKQKLFRIFRKAPQRQTTIGVVLQNQVD